MALPAQFGLFFIAMASRSLCNKPNCVIFYVEMAAILVKIYFEAQFSGKFRLCDQTYHALNEMKLAP